MNLRLDYTPDATDLARIARAAQYRASEAQIRRRVKQALRARDFATVKALGEQLRSLQAAAING